MNYGYDIEVFKNFFSVTFVNADDLDDVKQFVLCRDWDINQLNDLKAFLDQDDITMIGYNNLFYDYYILEEVYKNYTKIRNETIYQLSVDIIGREGTSGEWVPSHRTKKPIWKQIDLMKMMAYDKLGIGLKQISINLKWHKIQDLPLEYTAKVTKENIKLILLYNLNDVKISIELYKRLQDEINLRINLSEIYDVDLINASDSKIANILLEKFYMMETGTIPAGKTDRPYVWLEDCIASNISFKTKKLQELKRKIQSIVAVKDNDYKQGEEIEFGNCKFILGSGGLHTDDKPALFTSDENYIIRDADVASYYPSIMILNHVKPEHLNDDFISILKKITQERLEAKKSGDKVKANGLKITINSIFGKLGSEFFWLYDPKAMLTVTISGQLYLLMLIESFNLAGIEVISANTDGVVCRIPRILEDKYYEITKNWENKTGFSLEFTDYKTYIRSDVNNYITVKDNGEIKEKGRYMRRIDLKKGYKFPIIPIILYEYFINNKNIKETIDENKDILDYCSSQKMGKEFILEYREENKNPIVLQKTNRFFVSKQGGSLVKVHKKNKNESGIMVGKSVRLLNDYSPNVSFSVYDIDVDFYIEEAEKFISEINSNEIRELKIEQIGEEIIENEEKRSDNALLKPVTFKKSKYDYYYDKQENVIYRGLSSLKYVNEICANDLEKLKTKNYNTFVDFLIDIEENTQINSRQIDILITIGYFDFYYNKKLKTIFDEFKNGKNKYIKTLKQSTKDDRRELLIQFENSVPNEIFDINFQIDYERKNLEKLQLNFPFLDKKYVYVEEINTKYSPKVQVYCLNNGKSVTLKLNKKLFETNPFAENSFLYINKMEKRKQRKMVNDEWVETNVDEWWILDYRIITDMNKIIERNIK